MNVFCACSTMVCDGSISLFSTFSSEFEAKDLATEYLVQCLASTFLFQFPVTRALAVDSAGG